MVDLPLKLLLVEDSDDDAELVVTELRDGGYEVSYQRVYTREGMRRALGEDEWDVIISDHNLPSFSATEALLLLLQSQRDIPFIIVSGTIGEELAVEAMKAGAHDYVMKDCLAKLTPAVRHAVQAASSRRMHQQAQREIKDSREHLRQLASHLETVREEERARLAREIHDELGGLLTALKMDISWLGRRNNGADGAVSDKLETMTVLADSAIHTMRRIITDLRPSVLDDLGLIATIEWQFSEFQKRMGLKGELELGLDPDVAALEFGQSHAIAIFRIFQESLTNIAKHAQADEVNVHAWVEDQVFFLEVRDNGRGFANDGARKAGSYGILGMHERAFHFGGNVEVAGSLGEGTCVRLSLPLHRDDSTEAEYKRR